MIGMIRLIIMLWPLLKWLRKNRDRIRKLKKEAVETVGCGRWAGQPRLS